MFKITFDGRECYTLDADTAHRLFDALYHTNTGYDHVTIQYGGEIIRSSMLGGSK